MDGDEGPNRATSWLEYSLNPLKLKGHVKRIGYSLLLILIFNL